MNPAPDLVYLVVQVESLIRATNYAVALDRSVGKVARANSCPLPRCARNVERTVQIGVVPGFCAWVGLGVGAGKSAAEVG